VNIILFLNVIGKLKLQRISQAMLVNFITTCSGVPIMKQTLSDVSTYFYILFRLNLDTFSVVSSSDPINWNETKPEIATSAQFLLSLFGFTNEIFLLGTKQQERQIFLISKQIVLRA
jgi:hypothetical protein